VPDYRLDNEDLVPGTGSSSFSLRVQTGCEVHPASYPVHTTALFLGVMCGQGMTLITRPHLVLRSRMSRSYTSSPSWHLHGGSRTGLLLQIIIMNLSGTFKKAAIFILTDLRI
jgi:hypothetical protein